MLNPNKIRQLLASLIVLGVVSIATVLFLKVRDGGFPEAPVPRLPGNIEMSLQKIHFTETRAGKKKWDLTADRADYDKGREVAHLSDIRLVVAGEKTTGDIAVTADRAHYNMKTKDVELEGRVIARSASGMKFTTEKAVFEAERDVILSPGVVTFSDGSITVQGTGMEFGTTTHNLRLKRDVTARVERRAR